jgi:hypothetical protein
MRMTGRLESLIPRTGAPLAGLGAARDYLPPRDPVVGDVWGLLRRS